MTANSIHSRYKDAKKIRPRLLALYVLQQNTKMTPYYVENKERNLETKEVLVI